MAAETIGTFLFVLIVLIAKNELSENRRDLSDQTRIGNTIWADLKEAAMQPDYQQ